MSLFIGTLLICLAVLWLTVLLIGGRNPNPPWYASDWLLADVQVPLVLLLAIAGVWFISRIPERQLSGNAGGLFDILAAVGVVAMTVLIINRMKVGCRLKQFAEMEAEDTATVRPLDNAAAKCRPARKLPWQVRLHLADTMGYEPALIQIMRCVERDDKDLPGCLRFIAFIPDQVRQAGVAVDDFDTLAAHPELTIVSGLYTADRRQVTIDPAPHRQVA
ncbi:hypothetical protein [Desulfosarcina variabilis]|uniref:hypothetical protein n=1 Tax=Desulfosarcina variabilis TaxID=2300 RepID=UPI003AFAF8E0